MKVFAESSFMIPLNLYIHIPFCASKCHYCHFFSLTNKSNLIPDYFKALEKEIDFWQTKVKDYQIVTIYFGGGTPSLVDPISISNLINKIKTNFNLKPNLEITLEANPETITQKKLTIYQKSHINRLSFGLQSCNNKILKFLGRNTTWQDFKTAYKLARKTGFHNINIDLIFGIPRETLSDWQNTLEIVTALNPEHISCYSLELDNNSYFGRQISTHKLKPLDENIDRKMYHFTLKFLKPNNYIHYEISNFAKPNFECQHNLDFWSGGEYLGLGAGAHSFFQNQSFNHQENLEKYIFNPTQISNLQNYTKQNLITKNLILNLRLISGIDISNFDQKNKTDILTLFSKQFKLLEGKKLIKITKNRIKLTKLGIDLNNQIPKTII